jgi:hypothetical protein
VCFDEPAPENCVQLVQTIAEKQKVNHRILLVKKNPDYRFHQAWVRRKGFLEAKNDRILTGDIDLQVYSSCLKAIEMLGKDDAGLVSLMKVRKPKGAQGKIRSWMDKYVRHFLIKTYNIVESRALGCPEEKKKAYFTGLYALWRPYWIDSEDEKGIKQLENPKNAPIISDQWGGYCGEDTFLRNCMEKRHGCVFLEDVGAIDYSVGLEETKAIQLKMGKKYVLEAATLWKVVKDSILHVRPLVLGSYMHNLVKACNGTVKAFLQAAKGMLYLLAYLFVNLFLRIPLGKTERDRITEKMYNQIKISGQSSCIN